METKIKGKTVKEIIMRLAISGEINQFALNHDLTAYNRVGDKAVVVYDDSQNLEKVYYFVIMIKAEDEWELIKIKTLEQVDAVDVMSEVNIFLTYYREKVEQND